MGLNLALLQLVSDMGESEKAKVLLKNLASNNIIPNDNEHRSIQFIGSAHQCIQSQNLAKLAKNWEKEKEKEGIGPLWLDKVFDSKKRNQKFKIGYLSSDFCNHPVGRFILPVLKYHNRNQFIVTGINSGKRWDNHTNNIKNACDNWVDLGNSSDLQSARVIADMQLDVLIELGGYTGESRIGILVHRPAQTQISYLGYFSSTYLQCIDAWIGDDILFQSLNKEEEKTTKLKIKGGYMAYTQYENLPQLKKQKKRNFRFGCFNNARKLTDDTIKLFAEVLKNTDNTEIALKSISFIEDEEKERIRSKFVKHGISPKRLIMMPWSESDESHLRCYEEIDAALDPIPYGGATTTCEALFMGVPVITLAGQGMVRRLSASILFYSDCKDWIASNSVEYLEKSSSLAKKGIRKLKQRISLRNKVIKSNIGNGKRLAQEIESEVIKLLGGMRSRSHL